MTSPDILFEVSLVGEELGPPQNAPSPSLTGLDLSSANQPLFVPERAAFLPVAGSRRKSGNPTPTRPSPGNTVYVSKIFVSWSVAGPAGLRACRGTAL